MRDEARIDLETQLEEARAAWKQAEQMGAELAERALQSDEELKRLTMLFERRSETIGADSKRALGLERWIAFLAGLLIYLFTCALDGHGLFIRFPHLKLSASLMCGAPSLYLFLRNSWHRFKIKHDWNSWFENEFANVLWQAWNQKRNRP